MTENLDQLQGWQQSWYKILNNAAPQIISHLHVLKYEDFIDKRLDGLSTYLGIKLDGDTEVAAQHQRVVRTRAYGNWRRWFTEQDVEFFKPIIADFLRTMGYNSDDWRLEKVTQLASSEGSDYMKKLNTRSASSGQQFLAKVRRRLQNLLKR
jgi:hypothetical protein